MRYAESRERSSEILRLTLELMGRHRAAFNPCSYALWYEHCAGLNPALSEKLDARLKENSLLSDEEVWHLYTQHILARDVQQYEGMRQELYRILKDTAANTEVVGQEASAFDRALAQHAEKLTGTPATGRILNTLSDLRSDTGRMRAMTAGLAAQLQASTDHVTHLTQKLQVAESQALLDALTGLRNRRGFEQAAVDVGFGRGGLAGTAVLMIDIDHFKAVNDEHGHVLGDKVLRSVAHVIGTSIKGRDIAARLGGEEFAVLLPNTSASGAQSVGNQIRTLVAAGRIKKSGAQGTIGQVTVSIGIAIAEEGDALEQLLERGDRALYKAKRSGRNRIELAGNQHPSKPI